jgi:hypothetical protein
MDCIAELVDIGGFHGLFVFLVFFVAH